MGTEDPLGPLITCKLSPPTGEDKPNLKFLHPAHSPGVLEEAQLPPPGANTAPLGPGIGKARRNPPASPSPCAARTHAVGLIHGNDRRRGQLLPRWKVAPVVLPGRTGLCPLSPWLWSPSGRSPLSTPNHDHTCPGHRKHCPGHSAFPLCFPRDQVQTFHRFQEVHPEVPFAAMCVACLDTGLGGLSLR